MTNYIERYWRDATPEDAIKEPPMVARFRNGSGFNWYIDYLTGIRCNHDYPWYSVRLGSHKHCQVYDAPDPGEGWRLIDPHKEPLREGDEFMFCLERHRGWIQIDSVPTGWAEKNFYRRRIEQPKPEPRYERFKWEDREQLRGRWIGSNDGRWEKFVAVMYHESEVFLVNGINAESLCADWHFLDTGEPVGRKVQ